MKMTEETMSPGAISAIRFTIAAAVFLPGEPLGRPLRTSVMLTTDCKFSYMLYFSLQGVYRLYSITFLHLD